VDDVWRAKRRRLGFKQIWKTLNRLQCRELNLDSLALFKIMALTKTQLTIGGIAIAVLMAALMVKNGSRKTLRHENDTLQQKIAQLTADNESLANKVSRSPRLPAPVIRVSKSSTPDVDTPTLYNRLKDKDLKLKPEQVEAYLRSNGRSAASLLAAYRTTNDPALLAEAMRNFPDNPEVAFEAAIRKGVSPDEQRQWLDVLKKSAPDNALANYLSALDYFNAGQGDQAVKEFMAASGKHFEDYSSQRYQNDAEAYLAAGYSVADAKFAAGNGLLLPQLQMTKNAGLDMIELAKSYQQTGDGASAQAATQMAIDLGQRYGTSSPGEPVLSQLVGLSIEMRALNAMDPKAEYGNNGQTVEDQLNQIKQQHENLRQQSEQVATLLPAMSEQDWATYNDRWLTLGEQNAYQWVINRYGRNSTTNP
jgi:tetratricopeptide (TPR) repeat protein